MQLPSHQQAFVDRFIAACRADDRVVAAFLGGSYARGTADAYSDLDVYLVTTDDAYADFMADRRAFLSRLGEPVFLEDFEPLNLVLFVFADDVEGELGVGRAGAFTHIHGGPHQILLDKQGILTGIAFPGYQPERAEQIEKLRRQIYWFWHDLSHFITALGREQWWSAYGQVEALRRGCLNLARLRADILDAAVGEDVYSRVEHALPAASLAALQSTFCPPERDALLRSVFVLLRSYQAAAPELAQTHGLVYPAGLERVLVSRLETLRGGFMAPPHPTGKRDVI